MADCTYRFTDQDGNERVIEGKAAFKAYLLDGGLQHADVLVLRTGVSNAK